MTIREIKTYKIYTRLNTSHERTIRIQQSQNINSFDGIITQSQEALISNFKGKHSHREPKYKSESFYENKPCQPPIVGIYKKLKWIEIEPTKKECFREVGWNYGVKLEWSNCRLKGICGMDKCLWMKEKPSRVCNLCYCTF